MGCAGSKSGLEEPTLSNRDATSPDEISIAEKGDGASAPNLARKKSATSGKRRVGVSAETASESDAKDYTPTIIPKSDAVRDRIAAATENNALFAGRQVKSAVLWHHSLLHLPAGPGTAGSGWRSTVCRSGRADRSLSRGRGTSGHGHTRLGLSRRFCNAQAGLAAEQHTAVIDAMFEIQCTTGQDVITQVRLRGIYGPTMLRHCPPRGS